MIGWTRLQAKVPEIEAQIAAARSPEHARLRETFWIGLGAIFAVGFGGAIGPEAGIIAVTAQFSAVVALKLGKTAGERRMLAEAGVSGALSRVYGSPAGGPVHSEAEDRAPKPVLFAAGLAGFAVFVILADALWPGVLALMHLPRLTAVRRLAFNMLIGNADMHMKNWSLIYPDRRYVSLAPAYDFVATVPYLPGDATNMKISRAKVFSAFSVDELTHLAVKAAIPKKMAIDVAKETVQRFWEHWEKEAAHLPMSDDVRAAVEAHMQTVPILKELS